MAKHSSASLRVETPHKIETTQITINEDHPVQEKLEALVDIICGNGGAQAAGALFVLMATVQNSTEPEALAYTAKHFAFTRCGELNLFGIVDAQIAVVEGELLGHTPVS